MVARGTVLVVDDDPSIRLLCRLNLELDGFIVREASTLADARVELADDAVGVVLLDVHVGSDDGVAFLDELKQSCPDVAVAMLTGTAERADIVRAGADAVIGKPFTLDELKDTVQKLLGAGSR